MVMDFQANPRQEDKEDAIEIDNFKLVIHIRSIYFETRPIIQLIDNLVYAKGYFLWLI
jgi:hypothetical protein